MSDRVYTTASEILAQKPWKSPSQESISAYLTFAGYAAGDWITLMALGAKESRVGGFFRAGSYTAFSDSPETAAKLIRELEDRQSPQGIYFLPNRIKEGVESRFEKRTWVADSKGEGLSNSDFEFRRVVYLDLDPDRPRNISATDAQMKATMARAIKVWDDLTSILSTILSTDTPSSPLGLGFSGNGTQIHIAVDDLPATKEVETLVDRLLKAANAAWGGEGIKVDTVVKEVKRLCPAFGSWKRKGANDPESTRIHRRSWFVPASETAYRLTEDQLRQLVGAVEKLVPAEKKEAVEDVDMDGPAPKGAPRRTLASKDDGLSAARAIPLRDVAAWLGLVEGDDIRCPGCGEVSGAGVHPTNPQLYHCFHDRCSSRPNKTTLDMVMEVKGLKGKDGLKEAYRLLSERFGLPALRGPGRPRKGSLSPPAPPPAATGADWESALILTESGHIRSCEANAHTILFHTWGNAVRWDERAHEVQFAEEPPKWDEADAPAKMPGTGDRWDPDTDDPRLQRWLQRNWGVSISTAAAYQAILILAKKRPVNPLADWLRSLKWDGTKRMDNWLSSYCKAEDNQYTRLAGRWWLISAVARAIDPGCKVDSFLILENRRQGIKKSLTFETLAGAEWFSDSEIAVGDKDGYVRLASRVWIHELGELASLGRVEQTKLRAFFTSRVDRYRPPYGKAEQEIPRHAVFCGTTNDSAYLKDDSGNRRYWPVKVHGTDIELLARDREQLWAEAVVAYLSADRRWWPETDEERALFGEEQELRRSKHPWEAPIAEYLSTRDEVPLHEILSSCLGIPVDRQTRGDQITAGAIVANTLAWEPHRKTINGHKVTVYVRGEDSPPKVEAAI